MGAAVAGSGNESQSHSSSRRVCSWELIESREDWRKRLHRRQERRRSYLVRDLKVASLLLLTLAGLLYGPAVYKLFSLRGEAARLEAECAVWDQKNMEVTAQISYADSEEFVRIVARQQLGLVDKGSVLYVANVTSSAQAKPTTATASGGSEKSYSLAAGR